MGNYWLEHRNEIKVGDIVRVRGDQVTMFVMHVRPGSVSTVWPMARHGQVRAQTGVFDVSILEKV